MRVHLIAALLVASLTAPALAQSTAQPAPAQPAAPATSAASATSGPAADASAATVAPGGHLTVPSGDLISVELQQDIGSRVSSEGDTFAVVTAADYYVRGSLVLPKGSPGYGTITHVKRAGSFHAGGEMTFTVKRLVAPDGTDVAVETNGATSDADKQTEQNGNALGQYLMWGVGVFAKRGNDMLVKKGATFHVSTVQNKDVPVTAYGTAPATLNSTLVKHQ
ncbi:MAG TPA: hypothetical protein VHT53_12410 [Candidatus Elarobacter sp.]|nr:hypothetical protein [Candidatus Elarobacter sp.]